LLVDPVLLLLAGNAVALLLDPLRRQGLLAVLLPARAFLRGTGLTRPLRRGLALLRDALFAALAFGTLLVELAARGRRVLPFRIALRGNALLRLLSFGLLPRCRLLPRSRLLAELRICLRLALGLLPRLGRALLRGMLPCGFRAALARDGLLPGHFGTCIGLRCGSMLLPLRRLLLGLVRLGRLPGLLVVLVLVRVARVLARVRRGIEAGGQQGAQGNGQQAALGNDVHGVPHRAARRAGRKPFACMACTTSENRLTRSECGGPHSAAVGMRSWKDAPRRMPPVALAPATGRT
jgi:hypothetical protein